MPLAHLGEDRVDRVGERIGEGDRAEVLSTRVRQRHPADLPRGGAVDDRVGLVLAAVERRGGGHHLEGRAGRIARLGRAVEERLGLVGRQLGEALGHQVRVVLRHAHHHAHPPGLGLQRDDGAVPAGQRLERRALAVGIERGGDVLALAGLGLQLGEDVRELVLLARQVVVARALQAGAAARDERVAHGVGEERPGRIGAGEGALLAPAAGHAARDHRAVGGPDQPARDALLLDQRAAVRRSRPRAGPARRPPTAT